MYLVAAPFLAHLIFITAFYFFGPEAMGLDVKQVGNEFVVSYVTNASPAQRADIQPGDVLVRANGHSIPDINYWYWFFTNVEIGRPIVLETERQGQRHTPVLVLNRRPVPYWFTGEGFITSLNLCGRYIARAVTCLLAFLRPKNLLAGAGTLVLAIYAAVELVLYDGINSIWRRSPFWFQLLLWLANAIAGLGWGIWFTFFALGTMLYLKAILQT